MALIKSYYGALDIPATLHDLDARLAKLESAKPSEPELEPEPEATSESEPPEAAEESHEPAPEAASAE